MYRAMLRFLTVVAVTGAPAALADGPSWYRGALHTHANHGAPQLPTTAPDTVARWYREHGYQFVCLTDLNYRTPTDGLKALLDAPGRFLVLPGVELNQEPVPPGARIVDTIGLFVARPVTPPGGSDVAGILDAQAKAIRAAGGLPVAAHPNFTWAISADDLAASDRSEGPRFFEVWNTEPGMNNAGGGGKPSTEELWDAVLSQGRLLYGVAVDDSHHFYEFGATREADRRLSNPGKAWVMVRAPELSAKALKAALVGGDFYATTGVMLTSFQVSADGVRIGLPDAARDLGWSAAGANPQRYRTEFIGKGGRVLATDESLTPSYVFTGTEAYVRARVTGSDGEVAWTQPVLVPARPGK